MRILIIDDELSTRESIKVLAGFCEEAGDEIFEAHNGIEGYQMIKDVVPDLVFLDMNMPVMDGADLLSMLEEKDFPAKIIVVSGYTDFRYTKAAVMKPYVVDYIQKPIDERQIKETIMKITGEERYFNECRKLKQDEIQEATVCGIFLDDFNEILNKNYNGSLEMLQYFILCQIRHQIDEAVPCFQNYKIYPYAFFFTVNKCKSHCIKNDLHCIWKSLKKRYEINSYIIYNENADEWNSYKVYTEMCECLNYINLNGDFPIMEKTKINPLKISKREPLLWAMQLISCAENHNREELTLIIENLLKDIDESEEITIYELKIFMSGFLHEVGKRIKAKGIYADKFLSEEMAVIYSEKNVFAKTFCKKWLENFCQEIYDLMKEGNDQIPEKLKQILHYIQNNYFKKISLTQVADKFYFNSSTVSRMFVKYLGINYIDYVNSLRLEKAKELLDVLEISISDVAERTGFESQSHFSKQFKKKYGISPKKYKSESRDKG